MAGIRFPGKLRVSTRFFGQFTARDLARLITPLGLAYLLKPTLTGFTLAAVFAVTWYWWTPYGQHLDTLLYNLIRWNIQTRKINRENTGYARDDHINLGNGQAVAFIEITPTNLDMKTEPEKHALHSVYQNLIDTVNYPIHVTSRQEKLDLENYTQKIKEQIPENGRVKQEYIRLCQIYSEQNLTHTKHYIKIFAKKDSKTLLPSFLQVENEDLTEKTLKEELNRRANEVLDTVNTAELQAERVTGQELKNKNLSAETLSPPIKPAWTLKNDGPVHNGYKKSFYIQEYPSSVEFGWPLQLLRVDGSVDITQVIEPRKPGKAASRLQRVSEKLNAEIDSFLSQGYRGTNKLETLLEDTEWMLDLFAERKSTPVDYGVYITSKADTEKQCIQTHRQVKNRLNTLQIQYRSPILRTDQAYITDHPGKGDKLRETQLLPSTSAAAGFPFGTQTTQQNQGVIYGVDTSDETPVLADRYSWSSHSMARMGMVGSGKSYAAKVELLRSSLVYQDLQIIIVDPKQEYNRIIEALNGRTQTLDTEYRFTDEHLCFQINQRGQREDVEQFVDLVQEIYSYTSQNQDKTLVLIDEARILMNHETGRRALNQFVLEARDTQTAITLISQNASHFTYCREGREILDNMPGKVFMRHDRVPDSVVDYFQLSNQEQRELHELKTGTESQYSEALLKISGKLDTRIQIESTPIEDKIIQREQEGRK
jgi:hypothetical protein